ncbi:MAG: NAD-dependent epimerase/dehydratase family protein [Candidatus Nitronauta litoralis]|uniref:NAD-dependent epimerase/dehydratase family protein n=1 Tax=Candidatus Nitronauta litoralis TaxID=2705533 RepID=A0A7T0BUC5_9BACT|nr:MAG: NAD-dependent epimerase/dehydratase family protein [Candidatus Nitronauta litoralis]
MNLVTGAAGFLGRALMSALETRNIPAMGVDIKDGDIADPAFLKTLPEKLDRVFHLAAQTYVPDSWERPQDFIRTNALGTGNILQHCVKNKTPVTLISGYLYGTPEQLPIPESHPLTAGNPYGLSKKLAEEMGEFYHRVHNVPITIIRPFNIYGPGQNIKFLIPTIIDQVLNGDKVEILDLAPKRDFLFYEDLVEALILTRDCTGGLEKFNIGSGYSIDVKEVIDTIQRVAGTDKPVHSKEIRRQNEVMDVVADITRAKTQLGWTPRHSFEDGIRKIIKNPAQ